MVFCAGSHGWEDIENNRRIYAEAVGEAARLGKAEVYLPKPQIVNPKTRKTLDPVRGGCGRKSASGQGRDVSMYAIQRRLMYDAI